MTKHRQITKQGATISQNWIVIYIAAVIVAINGHVQDLHVSVIPVQTRFAGAQNVDVLLKYSNEGDDSMSLYKWFLPERELHDPLFEVTRDGQHVEYVGPLYKRRVPTVDDVISLAPGATVSAFVKLSSVYNMTKSGNYIIRYKMNADQVLFTVNSMVKSRTSAFASVEETVLQSAPIAMFIVGRRNQLIEQTTNAGGLTRALTPTYSSCSSSQASAIITALKAAESYTSGAIQYLTAQSSATSRYITWFGRHSSTNWNTLKSHFTNIQNALNTKTLSFDCACPAGSPETFAYVYGTQHYKIYLCGQFWPASTTGTDTKGGTIIHELAHFKIVGQTGDHMYGQTGCKQLALSDPAKTLTNSDSLQYFAENNPRLS